MLAVLNGGLRQSLLVQRFGERTAHVLSTLILSALIAGTTWLSLPWLRLGTPTQAWMVGGWWLALTIAFEFLAGHFLFRVPWSKLLADYNVAQGRIWMLVLLTTLFAPIVAFRLSPG